VIYRYNPFRTTAAEQVAKASWLSPVLVCFILGLRSASGTHEGLVIPAVVLTIVGIGLAFLSIFAIPRDGAERILPQAVVGFVFNIFILALFFYTMS
jgi:hypothetical protein